MDYFLDHHENILGMILIWDIKMHLASRECSRAGAKGVNLSYMHPGVPLPTITAKTCGL